MKTAKYSGKSPNQILRRLQKSFPTVRKVVDATDSIRVSVLPEDSVKGRKGDPQSCALARACVREEKADGAVIGLSTSYVIKGKVAKRYKTSVTVSREITSFDRHHDFATGKDYILSKIAPSVRLGRIRSQKNKGETGTGPKHGFVAHHTARVRLLKRDT